MHPGTINIDISPYEFSIAVPDYEVTCEWIDGIKETFWLTSVGVICDDEEYDGYIYFPRISEQHHARNHMVEVITKKIDGIAYGAEHMLKFDHTKVTLVKKEESE